MRQAASNAGPLLQLVDPARIKVDMDDFKHVKDTTGCKRGNAELKAEDANLRRDGRPRVMFSLALIESLRTRKNRGADLHIGEMQPVTSNCNWPKPVVREGQLAGISPDWARAVGDQVETTKR